MHYAFIKNTLIMYYQQKNPNASRKSCSVPVCCAVIWCCQVDEPTLLTLLEEVTTVDSRQDVAMTLVKIYLGQGLVVPFLDSLNTREVHSTSKRASHEGFLCVGDVTTSVQLYLPTEVISTSPSSLMLLCAASAWVSLVACVSIAAPREAASKGNVTIIRLEYLWASDGRLKREKTVAQIKLKEF